MNLELLATSGIYRLIEVIFDEEDRVRDRVRDRMCYVERTDFSSLLPEEITICNEILELYKSEPGGNA